MQPVHPVHPITPLLSPSKQLEFMEKFDLKQQRLQKLPGYPTNKEERKEYYVQIVQNEQRQLSATPILSDSRIQEAEMSLDSIDDRSLSDLQNHSVVSEVQNHSVSSHASHASHVSLPLSMAEISQVSSNNNTIDSNSVQPKLITQNNRRSTPDRNQALQSLTRNPSTVESDGIIGKC